MGMYIQTKEPKEKARQLIEQYNAREVDYYTAVHTIDKGEEALVIVVENGPFDAALFAYSMHEFALAHDPKDPRPKRYLVMDMELTCQLTGSGNSYWFKQQTEADNG